MRLPLNLLLTAAQAASCVAFFGLIVRLLWSA